MKTKLLLLLLTSIFIIGCGSQDYEPTKEPNLDEIEINTDENIEKKLITNDEELSKEDLSYEVDIILQAYMFDNNGIDAYVEQLKADNPNKKFSVYNDEYYIMTITEEERLEQLKNIHNNNINELFSDLITDEQYSGAFIDFKYDDSLQNFEIYVNKEIYEKNIFICSLGSALIINTISDSYQAYNLIQPEDRITNIVIIDNQTKEIIE